MYQQQGSFEYNSSSTTWNSNDNVARTSSTHVQGGTQVLHVNAIGANFEKDGQKIGTQDPFFQFTVNLEDKKSFQKTFTHNNGGKTPSWNQSFNVTLMGEPDLFVEVLDEEKTAPALIGFAAIPINQVVHAPGAALNGHFDLYDVKNNVVGSLHLILQAQGFQNSSNQQPSQESRGQSYVNEAHQKRCKSIRNKEHASDAAGAIFGGALAIGAGLLGKKYYDGHKKEEEEERERQEEEERRQQDYTQREEELKRRESEFGEREAREKEERRQREENERRQGGGDHHHKSHHEDNHHQHHHKSANEWDPVGTYAAGDRVEYHGRTYLCLQGHTSNPTWEPTVAASLWRAA
jgi:hypothetical protein